MVIKLQDLMWAWDTGEDTIGSSGIVFCCKGEYLICKRTDDGTMWSIPWGRIKEGDDPLESAIREVLEECGISVILEEGGDRPELIAKYTHEGRPCYVYSAEVEEKPEVYLNFEHSEFKWVKASQLPKKSEMWKQIHCAIKAWDKSKKSGSIRI